MTDTDPGRADILIVGASSAKSFQAADVGSHDQFIDALWNRNGKTCRAMYAAATTSPSKTRSNLDRLSEILTARGLTPLQTNVSCASARYDVELSEEDRAHGTELFKAVVAHVPWRAMIVYGVGASKRFGAAFGVDMPRVPSPDSTPVHITFQSRKVYVAPTLAAPGYRASVWPYLDRVVESIADGAPPIAKDVAPSESLPPDSQVLSQRPHREAAPSKAKHTPTAFCSSAANQLVWGRMHAVEEASNLVVKTSKLQASLTGGPKRLSTTRVFRHNFRTAIPDLLVREDVFRFDPGLKAAAKWKPHKTPGFQALRTDDMRLLGRILDSVEAFALERAP